MYMVSKLKYGNTNTYFIRGTNGNLLIDTDYAGTLAAFFREIKKHDIKLSEITYVLATHYHPDHIGIISELITQGVQLLLLDTQAEYVHFSDEIFSRDKRLIYQPINIDNATIIRCNESRKFLESIGISGEIVSMASHSLDSISVILDDGRCFVGDLEPIEYLGGYENNDKLSDDWNTVMSYNPKIIYYAHANEKILKG